MLSQKKIVSKLTMYRSILNAPPYAPNVRGEIGASLMKKRIIQGRLSYMKSIMSERNQIMHIIY